MSGEWGLLIGFFAFVMAMVSVAGWLVLKRREPAVAEEPGIVLTQAPPAGGVLAKLLALFHNLGELMPSSESSRRSSRRRLNFAGYRQPSAISVYFGLKCATAMLMALVMSVAAAQTRDDGSMVLLAAVCGLGLGFLIPERFLDGIIRRRNERLRRAMPPALDLMVMSLEAGQSLDQAMLIAGRGLKNVAPELSAELVQVCLETRASKSRAEALRQLAERNSEPEIRKFCFLLLDSDRFGASLAPTLRQHARFLRVRFRQRAQEAARKVSTKLVFPVFFLIFPAILVVTLGPAVLTMMKHFKNLWN